MPAPAAFGRRQPATAPPIQRSRSGAASAPKLAPRSRPPPPGASDLGPRAEALRVEIAANKRAGSSFDQWRRDQGGKRWVIWAVTLASFSPGLISLALNAPLGLSIGLEVAAFVGNIWLRRERRRRLREIVAWQEPAGAR